MIFSFLVIRLKSGQYIQIPPPKKIINADWLRWVDDDMLCIYIVFLISLGVPCVDSQFSRNTRR